MLKHHFKISYDYFKNTYGVKFEKLSFERKKHFFEHVVLRSYLNHLRQETHETSFMGMGEAQQNQALDASQMVGMAD